MMMAPVESAVTTLTQRWDRLLGFLLFLGPVGGFQQGTAQPALQLKLHLPKGVLCSMFSASIVGTGSFQIQLANHHHLADMHTYAIGLAIQDVELKIRSQRFGTPFRLEPKHVAGHVSAVPQRSIYGLYMQTLLLLQSTVLLRKSTKTSETSTLLCHSQIW